MEALIGSGQDIAPSVGKITTLYTNHALHNDLLSNIVIIYGQTSPFYT